VAPDAILGRDEELAAIASFFDDDRPRPRALLLEGMAGIGKTTLWREAVRLAEGRGRVLASRASEAETKLSFTVLGDLLASALDDGLRELPSGQRLALEAALLLGGPPRFRPDARAVSLAVFRVLRSLASVTPLTIAIDDVQWADVPSARALVFALRRFETQPVTVVAAKRSADGLMDPLDLVATLAAGLDRLTLGPIAPGPLGRLLRQRLGRVFPPTLVKRIHHASGGNPFYAVEMGRFLGNEEPNPRPGEPLPVPPDLQGLLRHRLSALSAPARQALLLAAASGVATSGLVEGAGGEPSGLDEAERAGIVEIRGSTIEFTHPLLASTVYSGGSSRSRRDVHARLARLVTDPEERARHLALSIDDPDEGSAEALEQAAVHAEARGAPLAAAELYQLAARITDPVETDRSRLRRQGSAANLFAAGDARGARELNERLLAELVPGPARAQTLYAISFMSWNDLPRVKGLLERALEEVGDNRHLRALILGDMAWVEFEACNPTSAIPWANAAVELAEEVNEPLALRTALAVRAMAGAVLGHDTAHLLERGISEDGALAYGEVTTPRTCLGRLQLWKGALDAARDALQVELDRYLEQGHESASWEVRADLAEVEYRAGRWRLAAGHALEAHEIVIEAGWTDVLGQVLPVKAAIECATGNIREARVDGAEALAVCERTGDRWNEIQARATLGLLELSLGDPAAAHRWLARAAEMTERIGMREPGAFPFVPDEVEALVSLGELEAAARLTDRLEEQGRALERPLALATAARCRGLTATSLGDLPGAMLHLQRALGEHERVAQPFELARTLLVLGEVKRRMKKKRPARETLERALEIFGELGAPLWAGKAKAELARISGRAPTPTELTATERGVAELAVAGRTNREIAAALFMSVKTVESHLRRIYAKTGVRSRTELAHRRAAPSPSQT